MRRKFKRIVTSVIILITVILILGFARPTLIIGRSMSPTIEDKDILLINRLHYRFNPLEYNDIVIVRSDLTESNIIKRVIGLSGDKIIINNCSVYVNGNLLDECYVIEKDTANYNLKKVVPEGKIFVLGDNRILSRDSRDCSVRSIDVSSVIGKAYYRLYPRLNRGII